MQKPIQLAFIYGAITLAIAAGADNPQANSQSADMKIVREYFSHFVRKVQQPFYLYHWRHASDTLNSEGAQKNPQRYGRQIVEEEAPAFIPGLYMNKRTNAAWYGGGLYAALDPIATEFYGGRSDNWALLVMHIPVGFQMLNLRTSQPNFTTTQQDQLKQAFEHFNCPNYARISGPYLAQLFQTDSIPATCANLVSTLITEFNVDGFLYDYHSNYFGICQVFLNREEAVVFTSSTWLKKAGGDARVYTSLTKTDFDEREMLENIFLFNRFISLSYPLSRSTDPQDFDRFRSAYLARSSNQTVYNHRFHPHWNNLNLMNSKNPIRWIQDNIFDCGNTNFLAAPSDGIQ